MKTVLQIAILTIALPFSSLSQSFPTEMHLSPDGHMLLTGDKPNSGLYDQSEIRTIYLTFPQPNFWTLMQANYSSQTDIPATMVVDGVTYDSVGVRFRGQTSYSQVSTSQKKSFNISVDYVDENKNLMGYKTLNLMNCFDDESFMREVFFQRQIKKHIPAAKSAFTQLYINNQNWGLYPNVQQLNKDFYQEWFMSGDGTNWRADKPPGAGGPGGGWGDGTAALNYLGPDSGDYKPYYTLKRAEKSNPWADLTATCDLLNNTPIGSLPSVMPSVLDVDRTLWFLASENLFADDDSYIMKGKMDYYLYWEPETGRMTPQEYDGNSVMLSAHQAWSPFYHETNVNYPLLNRLLAVTEYRQRYLAHMRTLITELYDTSQTNAVINNYKSMIDTIVLNDPKKLYTYNQFVSEIAVLKNFINARKAILLANAEVAQTAPVISATEYLTANVSWTPPAGAQNVTVRTTAVYGSGVYAVNLFYSNALTGNFTKVQMFDDGAHDDLLAADGIYGAVIPGHAAGTWIRFYVEAVANTTAKSATYDPPGAEHNVYIYNVVPALSSDTSIVINELMASNSSGAVDNNGENDDWIELYNRSATAVDISGYSLTDNETNLDKWIFPSGTTIAGNGYLIIWADEDSAQNTASSFHANFKLSASGERLMLLDAGGLLVDSTTWGLQVTDQGYARVPNGYGNFVIQLPTFNGNNSITAVEENEMTAVALSVFPNPSKGEVCISTNTKGDHELYVTNAVGQPVVHTTFSGKIYLNTTEWPSGLYLINCGSVNKKLIVNH